MASFQVINSAGELKSVAQTTDASLLTAGVLPLARLVDLTNAQLAAAAAIDWSKISKAGSSLADLVTRSAADLGSGTLAKARMHADYPDRTIAEAIAGVWDFSNGLKERGRTAKMGEWISVAYNAANFTSSSGTWTVAEADQATYAYMLIGSTMFLDCYINATDVATTPTALKIAVPGGFTIAKTKVVPIYIVNAGTPEVGRCLAQVGTTVIDANRIAGSTWTDCTALCYLRISIFFEVTG